MNITERLKEVVSMLRRQQVRFALAGGLVASLYRKEKRLTQDLDFLFLATDGETEKASRLLEKLGLEPSAIRKAQLEGGPKHLLKNTREPVCILAGRAKDSDRIGVDFILSSIPWFGRALERAEMNLVNFGFEKLPCLTLEDLILSKFYALRNRSDRFKDLDDLQDIFSNAFPLDLNYLTDRMTELRLPVPRAIRDLVPPILVKASKGMT